MKITVLVENTSVRPELTTEHGLGLHISWRNRSLMMDFGHKGAVVPNADVLGVELSAVEYGVLSHGHFDHGGGIAAFREKNPAAPIYVHHRAFGNYWAERMDGTKEYIGLDPALRQDENIHPVEGVTALGDGALLFDGITGRELFSPANDCLLEKRENGVYRDAFSHEQAMILPHGSGYALFGGCAHNGIVNVVERAVQVWGKAPDLVLSGFHLADPTSLRGCDPELTEAIAWRLVRYPTRYYTCHCTGLAAYDMLKRTMGDAVEYAACGDVIEL